MTQDLHPHILISFDKKKAFTSFDKKKLLQKKALTSFDKKKAWTKKSLDKLRQKKALWTKKKRPDPNEVVGIVIDLASHAM